MVFLKWPKQQRHHDDHYSQTTSSISQYRKNSEISVFKWDREVDRDGAEVTSYVGLRV